MSDPFETLKSLAPQASSSDLAIAKAMLERRLGLECKVTVLPRPAPPRRRRTVLALVVAGVAAAGIVVGAVLPINHDGPAPAEQLFLGAMPAAAAENASCGTHPDDSLRVVPHDEWGRYPAAQAIMVTVPGSTPLDEPVLGTWEPSCTAVPLAVFFDGAHGRAVTLYRDVAQPFAGYTGLVDATVQGRPGKLLSPPSGMQYLTWVDRSGTRWLATAGGLSGPELIATLDHLALDDGVPETPEGFTRAANLTADTGQTGFTWSAQYGPEPSGAGTKARAIESPEAGYTLVETRTPALAPIEETLSRLPGVQLIPFGGSTAAYLPQDQGGAGLRWITDGVSYRLVVAGADSKQLIQIASTLVRDASPDDTQKGSRR